MSLRTLVLTAGFGEGHNAAARALAAALTDVHGPGSARVVDAFALTAPRRTAVGRAAYLTLINRAPRLWNAFYGWADRLSPSSQLWRLFHPVTRRLARLAAEVRPDVICSTYPLYAFLWWRGPATLAKVPFYNVVTDSISLNALWWRAGASGWFMAEEDSAEVLRRAGVEAERIEVCGFPVDAFFAAHGERLVPPDLATGATPRVLYIVNSGTAHAHETARRLLAETTWEVTCAVGRDDRLRRELARLSAGRVAPARILGWTAEIPRLLLTHHVVVSKAGGATTHEAIAARCPLVVNQIVPGQEEGNYELLRRHKAGAFAPTPDRVLEALRDAFANGGKRWSDWRANLRPLSRPGAAAAIVARIAERSERPALSLGR
ncbi:MAG: galactosyldiacylglycerol synthase [Verrucomicrobia bacterium]|nr:galactosyldiacylglycerol synthase [Verrucomicrobiota bacterium]